jgi:hypothetical protein
VQFGRGEYGRGEYGGATGGAAGFRVAGAIVLAVSVTVPPPSGFQVAGNVGMSVTRIGGTVLVSGSFQCAGQVTAGFTPTSKSSFAVEGEVGVHFLRAIGQATTCISGPDTPPVAKPPNAVF